MIHAHAEDMLIPSYSFGSGLTSWTKPTAREESTSLRNRPRYE